VHGMGHTWAPDFFQGGRSYRKVGKKVGGWVKRGKGGGPQEHVDSDNIKLKIGYGSSLYQL
jgi:hypothetical protein